MDKGFRPEMLTELMEKGGSTKMIKTFIGMGNPQMIEPMLKNVDMIKQGGDLLETAIAENKPEIVELLIQKGADIMLPPDKLQDKPDYRMTPFSISAAQCGNYQILKTILKHGGSLSDSGPICLSKKRKNVVISNILGAAAWSGQSDLLRQVIKELLINIDLMALEQADKFGKSKTPFEREFYGYTPLMLAVTSKESNLECIKIILNSGADYKKKDEFGNNLLHLAARTGNNKILDYIAKNLKIGIFERNKAGETALGICQSLNHEECTKTLESLQASYDTSKSTANELLNELNKEEENEQEAAAKRRQKKWRNKINKIAKAENISVEEVEERLKKEEEKKKQEEAQAKLEEANKAKREEEEAAKRKSELKKQLEQHERELRMEELAEKKRIEAEEREIREERRKEQAAKKERFRSSARENKPETDRKPQQQKPRAPRQDQDAEAPSLKKERVKTPVRKPQQEVADAAYARPNRHQAGKVQETPRPKSKSVRRGGEEIILENKLNLEEDKAPRKIYGLGANMELASTMSKKAKQRINKKLKEAASYEEEQKAMLENLAKEKSEAQQKKFDEERKLQKEDRDAKNKVKKEAQAAKKKADDEVKAAAAKNPTPGEDVDAKKNEKKRNNKKKDTVESTKGAAAPEDKPKLEYRPKTAPTETKKDQTEPKKTAEVSEKAPKAKKEKAPKEKKPKNEQAGVEKAAEDKTNVDWGLFGGAAEVAKTEKKSEAPAKKESPAKKEAPAKKESPAKKEAPKKKEPEQKVEKKSSDKDSSKKDQEEPRKADASSAKPASAKSAKSVKSTSSNAEVEALQKLLIAKENEIGRLQKHIDKQDAKVLDVQKVNENLNGQLKQNASKTDLSQSVASLNEKLRKQTALNRLQASQILEFEQALWQANKQVEQAEQSAYEQSAPGGSEEGLLQDANHELRVKQVQIREMQQKIDSYQGKATSINSLSRIELKDLEEQLTQSLFNIKAVEHKN